MKDIIMTLGKMSIQGSTVILAVLAIRLLFDKLSMPKKYINVLWILPFVCLLLPWRPESSLSIWQHLETAAVDTEENSNEVNRVEISKNNPTDNLINTNFPENDDKADLTGNDKTNSGTANNDNSFTKLPKTEVSEDNNNKKAGFTGVLSNKYMIIGIIWLAGVMAVSIYSLAEYFLLLRKVRVCIKYKENIYYAEGIKVPFTVGIISPRIYIPANIKKENLQWVVAHEKTHILRKDTFKKIFAYAGCCIHWFNPFVWIAFMLFEKDMEMACDEATIEKYDENEKSEYASVLLEMAVKRRKIPTVQTSFGENVTKKRIKNILKNHNTIKIMSTVVALIAIAITVLFLTDAVKNNGKDRISTEESTTEKGTNHSESEDESTTNSGNKETEPTTPYWMSEDDYHIKDGQRIVTECDIDNDGINEKLIISGVLKAVDYPSVYFSIEKDNKEIYRKIVNDRLLVEDEEMWLDISSVYVVNRDNKNYLLMYSGESSNEVAESYKLLSVDQSGNMETEAEYSYSFYMNEDECFGFSKEDIDDIVKFYTDMTGYLQGAKLIFDTDSHYDFFVYGSSEDEKCYEDAKTKVLDWFDVTPFDIELLNERMSNYGFPQYIIDDDDSLREKLEKMNMSKRINDNGGKLPNGSIQPSTVYNENIIDSENISGGNNNNVSVDDYGIAWDEIDSIIIRQPFPPRESKTYTSNTEIFKKIVGLLKELDGKFMSNSKGMAFENVYIGLNHKGEEVGNIWFDPRFEFFGSSYDVNDEGYRDYYFMDPQVSDKWEKLYNELGFR